MGAHDDAVEREFAATINRASLENESNTPDFILADAARRLLEVLQHAIKKRDAWYGIEPRPGHGLRDGHQHGIAEGRRLEREVIVAALRERADRLDRESAAESAARWLSLYVAEVVYTLRDIADEIEAGAFPAKGER